MKNNLHTLWEFMFDLHEEMARNVPSGLSVERGIVP